MDDTPAQAHSPAAPAPGAWLPRLLIVLAMIGLACWLGWFLYYTPTGHTIMSDRTAVQKWVHEHRVAAPLIIVVAYVILGACMLPVWWLQIAAGYCFGLFWGVTWCQTGATISAMVSMLLSRWLFGAWFERHASDRMAKIRKVQERLGHNGLLTVMAVRLTHVAPFAISNYLFGLTRIKLVEVALGSLLGGVVSTMFYAAVGTHDWKKPWFWYTLVAINAVLLIPLAIRYLKPEWFKKIGIE